MKKLQRALITALLIAALTPNANPQAPEHFPYTFSNFVWWSDAGLCAELKKRIPSLPNEITRNSPAESRIRVVLEQLLKTKGILAEVQIDEPSRDVAHQKFDEGVPPPSIRYSIHAPPEILIEKLILDDSPFQAAPYLKQLADNMRGEAYAANYLWSPQRNIREKLMQLGYLAATVSLETGEPKKSEDRYLVPITARIVAGPQYHVAALKADGGPLAQGKDLSPFLTAHPGDIAQPNPFGRLAGALRSLYWQQGYLDVEFNGTPTLDKDHDLATYDFKVTPGPQYRLHTITIENLSPSQEVTARKLLTLKPGDIFDQLAISNLSLHLSQASPDLSGYGMGYKPKLDKQTHLVDLTLTFYKQQ